MLGLNDKIKSEPSVVVQSVSFPILSSAPDYITDGVCRIWSGAGGLNNILLTLLLTGQARQLQNLERFPACKPPESANLTRLLHLSLRVRFQFGLSFLDPSHETHQLTSTHFQLLFYWCIAISWSAIRYWLWWPEVHSKRMLLSMRIDNMQLPLIECDVSVYNSRHNISHITCSEIINTLKSWMTGDLAPYNGS